MAPIAGGRLTNVRDRALLLFGFASAMRRSELAALNFEDIEETADGLRVTIPRSKTDQEGRGDVIAVPRGTGTRMRRGAGLPFAAAVSPIMERAIAQAALAVSRSATRCAIQLSISAST